MATESPKEALTSHRWAVSIRIAALTIAMMFCTASPEEQLREIPFQADILKYARATEQQGYPPGVLMIDGGWSKKNGDWDFDPGRFPDTLVLMKELHQLGFKGKVSSKYAYHQYS